MFTVYPGWLNLNAVIEEFAIVSVSGHLVYGLTLGVICQARFRGAKRPPWRSDDSVWSL